MNCPDCTGNPSCTTCGGDGCVPDWLTDSNIVGEQAAESWRQAAPRE